MAKYDDILNELVYRIDDVVYKFYSDSNELIAKKQNQESLLNFREKTISTINDMNVRSLEIISQLKDEKLVIERSERLMEKNEEIVASALNFINAATDRSELLDSFQKMADNVYESAKELKEKVDASGVVDRVKDTAEKGFKKAQQGLEELNNNPQFNKGKEVVIEKSKEALTQGAKWLKEGVKFVSDKFETSQAETTTVNEPTTEIFKDTVDDLESIVDEVVREEKSETEE